MMGTQSLILTLDSSGSPVKWSTWEEAICYKVKNLVAWGMGTEDIYFGGTSRLGERSTVTIPTIISIKNLYKNKVRPVSLTNRNLFGRDKCMCAYCGDTFTMSALTRDHIIPVSRGGKNEWTNVVASCKKCNNKKDSKLLSETKLELLYLPYVPSRTEGLILANHEILADQMEFLKARLPKYSRVLN